MSPQFLIIVTVVSASGADDAGELQTSGFAANYVVDRGIAANSEVMLADDFESWAAGGTEPPSDTWRVRRNDVSRTHVVPGRFEIDGRTGPGEKVWEIACWTPGSGSQAGGLSLKLGNYNHGLPGTYTRSKPIRVYFDNVVISRKYIGPMTEESS